MSFPDETDQQRRYAAAQIQRRHPDWLLMVEPYSRKVWAYPTFAVPPGTYFGEADPDVLETRMNQAEMMYLGRMP